METAVPENPCMKTILATRLPAVLVLMLIAAAGSGCQTVKPWQRETLGEAIMRSDRDPLAVAFAEHVWFSREAASGGRGVGGGGCGCN